MAWDDGTGWQHGASRMLFCLVPDRSDSLLVIPVDVAVCYPMSFLKVTKSLSYVLMPCAETGHIFTKQLGNL